MPRRSLSSSPIAKLLAVVAVISVSVLTGGCKGPRLELRDPRITAFDRAARTVSWSTTVENSAEGASFFCRRLSTEGHGRIVVQAYIVKESDLESPSLAVPAGGIQAVGPTEVLDVGESATAMLSASANSPQVASLVGYTHLLLTAYTNDSDHGWPKILAARDDGGCKRLVDTVLVPLP